MTPVGALPPQPLDPHRPRRRARRVLPAPAPAPTQAATVAGLPLATRVPLRFRTNPYEFLYGRPFHDATAVMLPTAQNPIHVYVSDDPEVRIRQSASFWRRNPGYFKVGGAWDALRGLLHLVPGGQALVDKVAPTELGYGQPMVDQMRWQIRTRRQPDNPWWMKMNARLVASGLIAEAYLRAGRADEIRQYPHFAWWLRYIELSDAARRTLKLPIAANYTVPGAVDDLNSRDLVGALSNAYMGASLVDRLKVFFEIRPAARKAYWTAHDESIQAGKRESNAILRDELRTNPLEAQFGSAWAHTIKLFRYTSPLAAGHLGIFFQRELLPQYQPVDRGSPTFAQWLFTAAIEALDPSFPPAPA